MNGGKLGKNGQQSRISTACTKLGKGRFKRSQSFGGHAGADRFVMFQHDLPGRVPDRNNRAVLTFRTRGLGAVLRQGSIIIAISAAYPVLGCHKIGAQTRMNRADRLCDIFVAEHDPVVAKHRRPRHHLDAPAQSYPVGNLGLCRHDVDRRQARGAKAVDCGTWDRCRPTSPHQGDFSNVRPLIANLSDAAE